ncbi:hybrid sensor histidine kinase/response regulator [Rhodovastum atsumiense]|uniref:histidine kinase n=1 Tax=Rhodovastum atsumiense TaxID=504468 RepID=A0A5M6IN77_9PROT|nr:PAS domain S-box protein [Rhodovastum atsumiense]KAA5609716.1 PAS domain S-box protein [Rhodovastum atsumiense]
MSRVCPPNATRDEANITLAILVAKEERMRLALEGGELSVLDWDIDSGSIIWSDALASALALPEGGFRDSIQGFLAQVHPHDRDRVQAAMDQAIAGRASYDIRFRLRRPDGTMRWTASRGVVVRDEAGRPVRMVGIGRDVTSEQEELEALRQSERRLRRLERAARLAAIELDLGDPLAEAAVSGKFAELWGLRSGDRRDLATLLRRVHPADRSPLAATLGRLALSGGSIDTEIRLLAVDGGILWMAIHGAAEPPPPGKGHRLVAACFDVTARHRAEDLARERLEELEATYAAAPVGLCVLDVGLRYQRINARMAEINGVPESAHLGRHIDEIVPDLAPAIEALLTRVTDTGEPARSLEINGETPAQPGVVRTWLVNWFPHHDATGTVAGYSVTAEEITDRKHAEQALRASEAQFRTLADTVPGIVFISDATGRTVFTSRYLAELTGLVPAALQGEAWLQTMHPDDHPRVIVARAAAIRAQRPYRLEYRLRRADGCWRWFSVRGVPHRDPDGVVTSWIGIATDVTDAVAAREALARKVHASAVALGQTEARFRAIFDAQFQFTLLLSPDGRVLEANRAALEAGGLRIGDVIGRPFWETPWWPDSTRPWLREAIAAAASGTLVHHEVELRGGDGGMLDVDFSLKPLHDPQTGQVLTLIAEGRDITEWRNVQARLAHTERLSALGQLAGGIAHDFNNVLQAIAGAADTIARHPGDAAMVRQQVELVQRSATRAGAIARRLLAFARSDELQAAPVDVAALFEELRAMLVHRLGPGFRIDVVVEPGLPPVLADPGQLETVLVNLVANARDAMPDGGIIRFAAATDPGAASPPEIRLCVTDTGTGMDARTLAHAEEPFFSTKPRGQGTGLGLAMARGFAEQSGGRMAIDSTPGRGTSVTLWLPQALAATDAGTTARPGPATASDDAAPRRVLVVDDDELVRMTVTDALEDAGFAVQVAPGAKAALELLARMPVEVMVTDLAMPEMDGLALIRAAREARPELPCVLLTGYAGDGADAELGGTATRHFRLLRKPCRAHELTSVVAELTALN